MWDVILNFIDRRKMWGYLLAFVLGIVCTVLYWTYAGIDERIAYLDDKNMRLEKHLNETLNQLKERNISNGSTEDFHNAISQLQKEIDTGKKTIASLEAEIEAQNRRLSETCKTIAIKDETIRQLEAQSASNKNIADSNAEKLQEFRTQLRASQLQVAGLQKEIAILKSEKIVQSQKLTEAEKRISKYHFESQENTKVTNTSSGKTSPVRPVRRVTRKVK